MKVGSSAPTLNRNEGMSLPTAHDQAVRLDSDNDLRPSVLPASKPASRPCGQLKADGAIGAPDGPSSMRVVGCLPSVSRPPCGLQAGRSG
jgi:hypothetical protein